MRRPVFLSDSTRPEIRISFLHSSGLKLAQDICIRPHAYSSSQPLVVHNTSGDRIQYLISVWKYVFSSI